MKMSLGAHSFVQPGTALLKYWPEDRGPAFGTLKVKSERKQYVLFATTVLLIFII